MSNQRQKREGERLWLPCGCVLSSFWWNTKWPDDPSREQLKSHFWLFPFNSSNLFSVIDGEEMCFIDATEGLFLVAEEYVDSTEVCDWWPAVAFRKKYNSSSCLNKKKALKQPYSRYLEELFAHSWTHLLVHHENNNAPVVHSSPPSSPRHLDVLTWCNLDDMKTQQDMRKEKC